MSSVSTPPPAASKGLLSTDGLGPSSRPGSSRLTTLGVDGEEDGRFSTAANTRVPAYLNLQRSQVQKRFLDLEWHQRFRIAHGHNNPHDSPFRLDKSETAVRRNRYSNVQPWDNSRVKLIAPIGGSDYINASPISLKSQKATPSTESDTETSVDDDAPSVALSEMRYIATQGPKHDQYLHFWTMFLQETVGPIGVVVMLTECYEGNKEKCSQYFPGSMDDPVLLLIEQEDENVTSEELGDPFMPPEPQSAGADSLTADPDSADLEEGVAHIVNDEEGGGVAPAVTSASHLHSGTVTLLSIDIDPVSRSEIRHMRLELGDHSKEVYHYLFNGWPDFGKPEGEDRSALLQLAKQSRRQAEHPANPRFVHCSAGVGRTGTFIAIDFLLHELENGNLEVQAPAPGQPELAEQSFNSTAFHENRRADAHGNGDSKADTWGKSGSFRESTPEAREDNDLIFDTVNKLREQRMMMVTTEIQYSFLYDVVREAFIEKNTRIPNIGVEEGDVEGDIAEGKVGSPVGGAASEATGEAELETPSEAETEIEETSEKAEGTDKAVEESLSEAETETDDTAQETEDPDAAVAPA